jgi:hypothetical protein
MGHLPPSKCWTCAKFLFNTEQSDTRTPCPVCCFPSCGECALEHVRRAHPAWFMKNIVPHQKATNENYREFRAIVHRPDSKLAPVVSLADRRRRQG